MSGVYDLVQGNYDNAKLLTFDFLNDSLLAGSAGWHNDDDEPQSRIIIFDTLGQIKDSLTLFNDIFLGLTQTTEDNKILVLISNRLSGQYDTYLYKLNQVLEQDTFYTSPFVYDSLCPYQIVSDTIVPDDCGVIVGVEDKETRGQGDKGRVVEVWPNPCSTVLNVSLASQQSAVGSRQFNERLNIEIFDIFGREAPIPGPSPPAGGKGDWSVNVSALPVGLYLVVVKDEESIVGSAKFIIAR